MDHFGIGAAIKSAVMMYERAARRTGRTTSLVESVKEGDRIIFADKQEVERVRRLCLDRGIAVECVFIPPEEPHRLFERGTSQGRVIFDHSWVEQYYVLAIERARKNIDELERQSSGEGVAHRETRQRAIELSKWNP